MNSDDIEEAYFLLRKKVQLAIVFYMMDNCAQEENPLDYARDFQLQYRTRSKRCSIPLERKIFLQQMILLLPKFSDFQSYSDSLPTPMEIDIDVNGKIEPIYVDFSSQLLVVTEFLDALHILSTQLKQNSFSSEDIFRIISKFGDLDLKLPSYKDFGIIKISINAVRQSLQHINYKTIAKECMTEIVRLFKMYLNDLPQQQSLSSQEALVWMKKANGVMMKCINSFACEGQYQDMIVNLLHESMELSFIRQPSNHHYEMYRYHLIRKWRYHKLLCTNAINIFIRSLNEEEIMRKMDDSTKKKYLIIVKFTKLFIKSYCDIHYERRTDTTYRNLSSYNKNHFSSDRKFLQFWADSLDRIIPLDYLHPAIRKVASSCFDTISSTVKLDYVENRRRRH